MSSQLQIFVKIQSFRNRKKKSFFFPEVNPVGTGPLKGSAQSLGDLRKKSRFLFWDPRQCFRLRKACTSSQNLFLRCCATISHLSANYHHGIGEGAAIGSHRAEGEGEIRKSKNTSFERLILNEHLPISPSHSRDRLGLSEFSKPVFKLVNRSSNLILTQK